MFETDLTGQPVLVDELDADWLLVLLAEKETAAREAERGKLRLAAQWCALHPATADTGVATWSDTGLPGMRDHDESLGGDGTPLVAAFTPEPFAAALGVSSMTGMQLLADALDLQHRHARIWARVEALEVAPWKARKVAQATHSLSKAAAAYVDAELAGRLDSCGAVLIERVVAQAIARFHPELLRKRRSAARTGGTCSCGTRERATSRARPGWRRPGTRWTCRGSTSSSVTGRPPWPRWGTPTRWGHGRRRRWG
jgi:hypothetical protein